MLVIDTFALFEWFVDNNPNYQKYFQQIEKEGAYISELVLLEFYHKLFHEQGKQTADRLFNIIKLKTETIELDSRRIKRTGEKRSQMLKQKKKLSYADCLNLVIADEFKAKVLTGDKEFKGMKEAEFVE